MSVSASGVSAASSSSINVAVLAELLEGPVGIADKLQSYQDAKVAADKALAALALGNDVVARLEAAKTQEQAAQDSLATALKDAERILADAKAKSGTIINNAQSESARTKAEIVAAQKAHTEWVAKTKADATANYKAATVALSNAEKTQVLHEAALVAANKTQEAANKSLKDAQDLLANAKKRSENLRAAIDAL